MGNNSSAPQNVTPMPGTPLQTANTPPVEPPPPPGATPQPPINPVHPIGMDRPHPEETKMSSTQNPNNPGTYEDIHKKTKEIFPQPFEGGKIVISRGLSSHFQINHTITLASQMMSGYRFGATYVGTKQFGPQESFPIMLGDIDASGNLNANVIHTFTRNSLSRLVAQFQEDKSNFQFVTDYKGSSYTASVTTANPDLVNGSGLLVCQYLQRIVPSLDIGTECMYQRGAQVPGGQIAVMSLAARINGEKWQLGGTLCPFGPGGGPIVHASYHHKINDTLQIGAEFETASGMGDSSASGGYQLDIPSSGITFKGQIDTNLTVQATLEKKLMESQLPFTFILSAVGSQWKSDYKMGIGLMFG